MYVVYHVAENRAAEPVVDSLALDHTVAELYEIGIEYGVVADFNVFFRVLLRRRAYVDIHFIYRSRLAALLGGLLVDRL